MKITTDKEGSIAIQQLCDIAFKAEGIKVFKMISQTLASITVEEPPVEKLPKEEKKK